MIRHRRAIDVEARAALREQRLVAAAIEEDERERCTRKGLGDQACADVADEDRVLDLEAARCRSPEGLARHCPRSDFSNFGPTEPTARKRKRVPSKHSEPFSKK
jgi:hypothetical protein